MGLFLPGLAARGRRSRSAQATRRIRGRKVSVALRSERRHFFCPRLGGEASARPDTRLLLGPHQRKGARSRRSRDPAHRRAPPRQRPPFIPVADYLHRRTFMTSNAIPLVGRVLLAAIFVLSAIGDQNQFIHLLKNFAIAGGLLQVAAFGAGTLSLDAQPFFAALRLK